MSKARTKEREIEFNKFLEKAKLKEQGFLKNALEWFQHNVGEIITSRELAQIPGKEGYPISHNLRRIFELRDEQGYEIINHKDNESRGVKLKVDEWILLKKEPNPKNIRSRGVNKRIAYEVFTRDDNTCQFCGRTPKDDDPFKPGHKIKLHVGHIVAHKRKNDQDFIQIEKIEDMKETHKLTKDSFITMCNVCNEGAKNTDLEILSPVDKVMKLDEKTQKEIYTKLKKKFS
jgi:5-methylcytosine-specific restriction endonuclease McrA